MAYIRSNIQSHGNVNSKNKGDPCQTVILKKYDITQQKPYAGSTMQITFGFIQITLTYVQHQRLYPQKNGTIKKKPFSKTRIYQKTFGIFRFSPISEHVGGQGRITLNTVQQHSYFRSRSSKNRACVWKNSLWHLGLWSIHPRVAGDDHIHGEKKGNNVMKKIIRKFGRLCREKLLS